MKYLNTYESWRKNKKYIKLPQYLIEIGLEKILNYISDINFKYDELSANIDLGLSLTTRKIRNEIKEIFINDIENEKLKNTIKFLNLFKKWNIYISDTKSRDGKNIFYISKDILNTNDDIYSNKLKIKDFKNIYIIAALHTEEHEKMKDERKLSYQKTKDKELEKLVNNAIKTNKYERSKSTKTLWNNDPILFKVVRENRIDLFDKIINSVSDEYAKKLCSMKIDSEGWSTPYGENSLLKNAKSPEMKKRIMSVLYTPEEIEQFEIDKNIKKYNL